EQLLLIGEGVAEDHRGSGKIPEYEFVALFSDRGRRGDVDDKGNALLLGDLRDRGGLTGIERANQKLRTVVDQFFSARPRHLHVGLGVGVHDRKLGQSKLLEDRRRQLDPALTVLTDPRLGARARQKNADLQRSTLRTREVDRRAAGDEQSGRAR